MPFWRESVPEAGHRRSNPFDRLFACPEANLSGKADIKGKSLASLHQDMLFLTCTLTAMTDPSVSSSIVSTTAATAPLLRTPLYDLHLELGAKMVPFAGYEMPVQYPMGLMQEHHHTRKAAGLFDVSHMGQISLQGHLAASALERLIPADILGLGKGQQRYGLLTNDTGGLRDDLMVLNRGDDLLVVVNGACKQADLTHIQATIGTLCTVQNLPNQALLALQGPLAATALSRLCDAPAKLVFMQGGTFMLDGLACTVTRSGYTGEDGFEISVPAHGAQALARRLLDQPEVAPVGLGARNSLRLEAGLCLYGNDLNANTNPVNANLRWALPKVRRAGGARAGGYPGAAAIDAAFEQLEAATTSTPATGTGFLQRVGLLGQERIPVREPAALLDEKGQPLGSVCSGLLSPVLNMPIAMAYLPISCCTPGTTVWAAVRDKRVPMQVVPMPFVPHAYVRQAPAAASTLA